MGIGYGAIELVSHFAGVKAEIVPYQIPYCRASVVTGTS